ncbi:MAG: polyphosphate kinase 2 [Prochlorococcaceae cyanobacterium]
MGLGKGKGKGKKKTRTRDTEPAPLLLSDDTRSALRLFEQALATTEPIAPPAQEARAAAVVEEGDEQRSLSAKEYERLLRPLHVELVKLQEWVKAKGAKVCVLFEGRDGAGKGGTIKAITERVSPRVFRVVALPTPTEREQSQLYMQRYVPHLPAAGEVVIFDRSWYNRAVVEPVMGYCTTVQSERFLLGAPLFERILIENDIHLLKYWLEVGPEEQERRLRDRIGDGRKIWKLSPNDVKSFTLWDEITRARDRMLQATDTAWAPWWVARSDNKRRVRLNVISHLLSQLPYEEIPREPVQLPHRRVGEYQSPEAPRHLVPEPF